MGYDITGMAITQKSLARASRREDIIEKEVWKNVYAEISFYW